ncbi:hypothetical protein DFH05DRAFT_1495135 [Lentinula detonsa]|uniref:Secreted protein n=1 Tax=Lentinula detonsa TaxID=2804962 RepID=A0A9W8P0T0_9AGAR|nr:hypothetical protein DFH05DRAFT_1495135 [Lentinula detonsa]
MKPLAGKLGCFATQFWIQWVFQTLVEAYLSLSSFGQCYKKHREVRGRRTYCLNTFIEFLTQVSILIEDRHLPLCSAVFLCLTNRLCQLDCPIKYS